MTFPLSSRALLALALSAGCGGAAQRTETSAAPAPRATLHVSGARILDTCGAPFRARGLEQFAGKAFAPEGSLERLAVELANTGSNAIRLLPQIDEVGPAQLDAMLRVLEEQRVVVYLSPGDRAWFARPEVRAVLLRHEQGLILDAFQEPRYEDVPRWVGEAKAAIQTLRASGYRCPLTVMADAHGRNLASILEHGQEIADSDPQHNLILGWQAYWGERGTYAPKDGMTLREGVERAAKLGFPVQLGIDLHADPGDPMNYQEVMALAEREGLGWMWWDFWNRWDDLGNNASEEGTASKLTAVGRTVVEADPHAIKRTAQKACFR